MSTAFSSDLGKARSETVWREMTQYLDEQHPDIDSGARRAWAAIHFIHYFGPASARHVLGDKLVDDFVQGRDGEQEHG